ncbi:hypothetical protein E8K88_12015 [Lampropedia aestuarii]|uniref:Phage tail assembly chaperone-like domain-containing protein n=1 Tax=Lampropedia aestuarii TaxID=2562762 RepID=A0A4S5BRE6_9BURK|nr:hypothetical protein E8K88_12015 [Lampropedia aestuarii]
MKYFLVLVGESVECRGCGYDVPVGAVEVGEEVYSSVVEGSEYRNGVIYSPPPRPSIHHTLKAGAWVLNESAAWAEVRAIRDAKLANSDWVVTAAVERGAPLAPMWSEYRQALRDITEQPDLEKIVWPEPPHT